MVRKGANEENHVVKVFTRLMLQGRVTAAVRWLSEESSSGVLSPTDMVETKGRNGVCFQPSVWDVLASMHPEPS